MTEEIRPMRKNLTTTELYGLAMLSSAGEIGLTPTRLIMRLSHNLRHNVSVPAVYSTMEVLRDHGLVTISKARLSKRKGGSASNIYRITSAGRSMLDGLVGELAKLHNTGGATLNEGELAP